MKKDIQILVVDDHQVVRGGLQHMIGQQEDMEVVGQSASGEEVLSQVEKLSPNIVLMDIKMPGVNGIELARQLLEKQPSRITIESPICGIVSNSTMLYYGYKEIAVGGKDVPRLS